MDNEELASTLDETGDYRVLRRLKPRSHVNLPDGTDTKLAIMLDLETTGLNLEKDEIIELAMVPFQFSNDGRIFEINEAFDELQQPSSGSIPDEITRITGITDDMVRGESINADKVAEIIGPAAVIIAHNANFDRKFAEKTFPIFSTKAWACSMTQIPWKEELFEGMKLEYLVMKNGLFYDAHRAATDCHASIELLARPLPQSGNLALQVLFDNARSATCRIWAENSPFDFKDILKARGYRWNPGSDGKPKSWYRDVPEEALDEEIAYLRKDIFQRNADIPVVKITAFERFSNRV